MFNKQQAFADVSAPQGGEVKKKGGRNRWGISVPNWEETGKIPSSLGVSLHEKVLSPHLLHFQRGVGRNTSATTPQLIKSPHCTPGHKDSVENKLFFFNEKACFIACEIWGMALGMCAHTDTHTQRDIHTHTWTQPPLPLPTFLKRCQTSC